MGCRPAGHRAVTAAPGPCPGGPVECQHLSGHLRPDRARVVVLLYVAVALEQVDHGEVRRRFAVGHRSTFEHQPPRCVMGMDELIGEP